MNTKELILYGVAGYIAYRLLTGGGAKSPPTDFTSSGFSTSSPSQPITDIIADVASGEATIYQQRVLNRVNKIANVQGASVVETMSIDDRGLISYTPSGSNVDVSKLPEGFLERGGYVAESKPVLSYSGQASSREEADVRRVAQTKDLYAKGAVSEAQLKRSLAKYGTAEEKEQYADYRY